MITINISPSVSLSGYFTQVVSFFMSMGLADRHEAVATIDLHGKDLLPVVEVTRVESLA